MQRSEPEAFATAALERFRYLHLYADRKLIAQGRFVETAHRLHRRTRNGLISSTLLGVWMIWQAIGHVRLGHEFGEGGWKTVGLAADTMLAVFGLAAMLGAAWTHGRTRELVHGVEALLPEEAPGAAVVTAT